MIKMKVFVLCMFVIANLSNNKASLESFLPIKDNMLLTDTTKGSNKSCSRPCKFNVKPRRCTYDFEISPSINDDGRPALTINDMTPGPPVRVCLHDVVIVKVKNKVVNQDLTIHWHGVEQRETPYMDGVPMITQCPISFGSTYEYAFRASSPGTFFYHADSVLHQSDGVYGVLIVDQPQPLEPHASLYDYDRSEDHTMIIGARFNDILSGRLDDLKNIKPDNIIINGDEYSSKIFVIPGYRYRLRFVNAIALECPLLITLEHHVMTVITSDGKPVKPATADAITLYPGERMSVVVSADRDSGGFWIQVTGTGVCEGLNSYAMLLYSGFNYTNMLEQGPNIDLVHEFDTIDGQHLRSLEDISSVSKVKSIYLSIDSHSAKFKDTDIDFRYKSDAMPKKPFFPAVLATKNDVVQINGKNFLYPNTPYLLRPREIRSDIVCNVGEESTNKEPQCMHVLEVQNDEVIEIILANEGFNTNDSYTFHMHGYSMQVLATWRNPSDLPVAKEDFKRMIADNVIARNDQNPPIKDTVYVPNKGLTIVRLTAKFGGSWLLECRSCSLSLPVAVLISVPLSIPNLVIDSLPTCGNYRPADVLLN